MDREEVLAIVGDLYVRNVINLKETDRLNQEISELKNLLLQLETKDGPSIERISRQ